MKGAKTMANETTTKTRRSKGDGTLFKNSKGVWVARFTKKDYPSKEFTGKTKAEAKAKLDQYKLLVLSGNAVNMKMTVAEYANKFLYYKEQQVMRKNFKRSSYCRLVEIYREQIEKHQISKILMCNLKPSDIQALIDELQPNYSFSTIKKVYLFLHSMIKLGKELKDFPDSYDPFIRVELPDESAVGKPTKQLEVIPEECLEKFKEVALSRNKDGTLMYRYGPALVFALNTGLRRGELIAISKKGIISSPDGRRKIHITETVTKVESTSKSGPRYINIITPPKYPRSVRIIPLNQEASMCLDIMLDTYGKNIYGEDYIISTQNGNFPTHRNIQETLDRILRRIGEQHYGTHAMRHTFATKLLSKTSSHQEIKAVAELLGDDYKVVVRTYLHTDDSGKCNLVDLLNA